ncbi:MAG TPA: response regulator transcription factor, partial [Segetibacter sp.]|nr:response regulator transcription factor [Segetibacter sp.]
FAEIEEVGNSEDLISKVMNHEWDVALTDISMPGRTGLDALCEIKQLKPKLPVLILSVFSEDQYAIRALKVGAAGYIKKDAAPDELVIAIRRVLSGKKYITDSVAEKLAGTLHCGLQDLSHEVLSDREFEVLKLLAAGKSISAIAAMLQLGVTTISTYRARILSKMNMSTNADLVQYAMEKKLL